MTSVIALAWEWGGEWGGCSSSTAQQAALAGLAGGRFGELREQVDAKPRVVFLGGRFAHKPQNLRIKCWPSNDVGWRSCTY
jgi:hypothetical protein